MTTDELLLIRIYNREHQALSELYDRYSRLLWKISYRAVPDQAICEEIVSRIFNDVWASPEKFQNKKLPLIMVEYCYNCIDTMP
ncbi:RNA polymerase sigma factor [Planomicrobium soli]|uniref:RNA polymerase sigma factor n=1 Tax=Planomicrobium soli TaxID=1176648 RepID=UPI000D0DD209|nr:sigma factor [Planomicrobium soli]